jgi:hypothetical protein
MDQGSHYSRDTHWFEVSYHRIMICALSVEVLQRSCDLLQRSCDFLHLSLCMFDAAIEFETLPLISCNFVV